MELFDPAKLDKIRRSLMNKKQTIAVAESVTAGLLQASLAQAEFASTFFQGGITAYNLGQKYRHLKVEPIQAELENCVSPHVSSTMAVEVCEMFGSHWGIGVTGYATPVPESGNRIFAYYAICRNKKIISHGKLSPRKKMDAFEVQCFYIRRILSGLAGLLR